MRDALSLRVLMLPSTLYTPILVLSNKTNNEKLYPLLIFKIKETAENDTKNLFRYLFSLICWLVEIKMSKGLNLEMLESLCFIKLH